MISHKYKCIFIHIQRTAGTSIENWIYGKDWWDVDRSTKHLIASQAKELYKDYWDEYFKFSFVRNPWDRMVSMLKFKELFNIDTKNGILDISGYKEKYGYPLTLEKRFTKEEPLVKKNKVNTYDELIDDSNHIEYSVYENILNEELDFVGKFENLYEDVEFIKDKLKIGKSFNKNKKESKTNSRKQNYRKYYDEEVKNDVYNLYYNDIIKYNYSF